MLEEICPRCKGDGTIHCPACEDGLAKEDVACFNCDGTSEKKCPCCNGKGKV